MKGKKIKVKKLDCVNCEPAFCEYAKPMDGQNMYCRLKGQVRKQKIRYYVSGSEVPRESYERSWDHGTLIGDGKK